MRPLPAVFLFIIGCDGDDWYDTGDESQPELFPSLSVSALTEEVGDGDGEIDPGEQLDQDAACGLEKPGTCSGDATGEITVCLLEIPCDGGSVVFSSTDDAPDGFDPGICGNEPENKYCLCDTYSFTVPCDSGEWGQPSDAVCERKENPTSCEAVPVGSEETSALGCQWYVTKILLKNWAGESFTSDTFPLPEDLQVLPFSEAVSSCF